MSVLFLAFCCGWVECTYVQSQECYLIPWTQEMKAELFVMVRTTNWQVDHDGPGQSHPPLLVIILRELVDSLRPAPLRSAGT